MVTETLPGSTPLSAGRILKILGSVTAIFSLMVGALVLFVLPGRCSFLGGLEVLLLAALFIAGVAAFFTGKFVLHG